MQAAHECCARHEALRAASCCCTASHRAAPLLGSAVSDQQGAHPGKVLPVSTTSLVTIPTSVLPALQRAALAGGFPPPDTLVSRHISLVL
jgi:hypothetical protein